jgi:hypothetical protein
MGFCEFGRLCGSGYCDYNCPVHCPVERVYYVGEKCLKKAKGCPFGMGKDCADVKNLCYYNCPAFVENPKPGQTHCTYTNKGVFPINGGR